MALYPQIPQYPPRPVQPAPNAVNRAQSRRRARPAGSVIAGDGKLCPIIYGRHFVRPLLGPVVYGRADPLLQSLDSIGLAWIFCLGPIKGFDRVYLDESTLSYFPNVAHQERKFGSGGLYNYFSLTAYHGQPDQPVDPVFAGMRHTLPNFSEIYADTNVYTQNGLAIGQAYIATVQNKLYDKPLHTVSALMRGMLVYDPRTTQTDYSENPALHLADFLQAPYGASWTPDWTSVGEAADFCDELIGGKPRNRGGFVIDQAAELQSIIERMRALAGVVVRKEGDTFYFSVDKPGASVFTFDSSNIVRDSFELSYRPLPDLPSQVEVKYTRSRRNGYDVMPPWEFSTVTYPGPGDPGYPGSVDERRIARVELLDCQDIDVALRYAKKMYLRQSNSPWRARLETRDMAALLYDGEVVSIDHPHLPAAANPMDFIIRRIGARHTETGMSYVAELEQYSESSYVDDPVNEPDPTPETSEPPGGTSGSTVLPLFSTAPLALTASVLVNIESFPDNYCGLADAALGIRAEGYVLKGEGSEFDSVEGAYIVQVNVNEGLMGDVVAPITKGRVYLANAGAVAMAPPADATLTQDIGTGEPPDRVLFHYSDPEITKWRGLQSGSGPWYPAEMVQSEGWLMRCLTTTTDPAAPQPEGEEDWIVQDDESFSSFQFPGRVVTGHIYTVDKFAQISGYRLNVADTNVAYSVSFWNADDINNPRLISQLSVGPDLPLGWNELSLASEMLVPPGTSIMLLAAYDKQVPATSFTHQWNYSGTSSGGDPGTGNIARNGAHTVVYISDLDENSVDRSASLATLKAADDITITEATDGSRWLEYHINAIPIDRGTYYEFPVELTASNSTVRNNRTVNVLGEAYAGKVNVDVQRDLDYWLGTPYAGQIKGFYAATMDQIPESLDDSLYCVDIKGTLLEASPDWDFMAYSGEATAISGATGAVRSVNSSTPDANGNVEFERLGVGRTVPVHEFDVLGPATPTIRLVSSDDSGTEFETDAPRTGVADRLFTHNVSWQGNLVASQRYLSGTDTSGYSDARWTLLVNAGAGLQETLRVQNNRLGIGGLTPSATLEVIAGGSDPIFRVTDVTPGDLIEINQDGAFYAGKGVCVTGTIASTHNDLMTIEHLSGYSRIRSWGPDATTSGGFWWRPTNGAGGMASGMRLTDQNYLGINNSAPERLLHPRLGGAIAKSWGHRFTTIAALEYSGASAGLAFVSDGAESYIDFANTDSRDAGRIVFDYGAAQLQFHVGSAEKMRLGETQAGIFTTTPQAALELAAQNPGSKLRVTEASTGDVLDIDENWTASFGGRVEARGALVVSGPANVQPANSIVSETNGSLSEISAFGPDGTTYGDFRLTSQTTSGGQKWFMTMKGDTGNIGVNEADPGALFHIKNMPSGLPFKVQASGFESQGSSLFQITDFSDTPMLTFLEEGRLGVWSSAPAARLHLRNPQDGGALLRLDGVVNQNKAVQISQTVKLTPTNTFPINIAVETVLDPSGHNNGGYYNVFFNPQISGGATANAISNVYNFNFRGTLGGPYSGAVTSYYNIHMENPQSAGTGTITNNYGIYIREQTAGTNLNYSLYCQGPSDRAYFGGHVGIGVTNPMAALDVQSTAGGIGPPQVTTAQRDAISSANPSRPQIVYNTSTSKFEGFVPGTGWVAFH